MPTQVQVPNVGLVEFPDEMGQGDIVNAIQTKIYPNAGLSPKDGSALPVLPTQTGSLRTSLGLQPRVDQPFVGQGQGTMTKSLLPLPLIRDPQNALEGGANSLVKGLGSLVSPLGVVTAPFTLAKPLQIPLMALFGGLGAKGVGQGLGQLSGTPNQTTGQKAEQIGDVLQQALMMLPALAHGLPETAAPAPQVPEYMKPVPSRPLTVDEINQRAALTPNSKAVTPPVTTDNPVPTQSAVSPFDKGKLMANTPEVQQPVEPVATTPSDWEQYQAVQAKMGSTDFGSPEFQDAWKENEAIKNRNGGMPPQAPDVADKVTQVVTTPPTQSASLSFQPGIKVGDTIIQGEHNPLAQKAYMDAQAAGQAQPVVQRGFIGSDGSFYTNPLDALRAKQKAQENESSNVPTQQQATAGGTAPQGREAEQEGGASGEALSSVEKAQGQVPPDAGAIGQAALGNNQQRIGGRVEGEQQAKSGSANEPNRKTTGESGFTLVPKEVWPKLGFAKDFKVAGEMLYNRLRNVIGDTSATWSALQSAGLRDFLKEKRTTGEVEKWAQENGPKVEVRKFGNERKDSTDLVAYNNLTHEIETSPDKTVANVISLNKGDRLQDLVDNRLNHKTNGKYTYYSELNEEGRKLINKYNDLRVATKTERIQGDGNRAHWQSIAPKSEQDMPGYTEIAVVKPVPTKHMSKRDELLDGDIKFPSSHSFPPNTLGFARGYMENVGGKKVFHVIEVQSDWAQRRRELEQDAKENGRVGVLRSLNGKDQVESDSLLPHYERLALKAAIEHARSEGATHIALSDAETAMMTEGHDRAMQDLAPALSHTPNGWIVRSHPELGTWKTEEEAVAANLPKNAEPEQSPGMRLHYDQTLPKILSDLTGGKGERVEMGDNKNAMEGVRLSGNPGERIGANESIGYQPRKDLIFRNQDGTPKTSVTGRMYPIGEKNPTPQFSLFGKDKGEAGSIFPKRTWTGTARTLSELRKAAQDPTPAVKAALLAGNAARKLLVNSIRTSPNKQDIVRFKDAADNKAVIAGQQARMGLDAQARVSFGKDYDKALRATTALVESGNDKEQLAKFAVIAKTKNDVKGLEAAKFALDNYDKMQPLLKKTVGLHDDQLIQEQAVGLGTNSRENYIRHVFNVDKLPTAVQDKFLGAGEGNGPRGFMKMRSFDTLYDAIEAGYGPAIKTWDAGSLAESRIKNGQQMVNDTTWLAGLRGIKDPTTKLPITENLVQRKNPATGDTDLVPPPGYDKFSLPTGQSFAVHKGYGNLLKSITSLSAIQKAEVSGLPVGKWALQGTGALKHSMLMFDTFHAIRMAAKGASLGVKGYEKGASLLEYHPSDLDNALKAGDITQAAHDYAKANYPKGRMLVNNGLNVGRVAESLYADAIHAIPLAGDFNKWVFEKETRGVMMESAIKEFDRLKAVSPTMSDAAVAKKVSRDMNIYFGNLGRQGLFRSKTFQDLSRLIALAPSWFESMARTEAGAVGQAGKYIASAGRKPLGSLAKGTGSLLFAMFAATQLTNMVTRHQPTWDNDEPGHKLDAWIPGGKAGFWVSPFSLPMELTHDLIRYTAQGKSPLDTLSQIAANKMSPAMRAEEVLRTGRDYTGQKLPDGQRMKTAAANLLPMPLPLQPLVKKGYPGQIQRLLLASAGIKTEPANTPTTIIANLRRQFLYKMGKAQQADYPASEYDDLRTALLNGDTKTAQTAYDKLYAEKLTQHQNDANPEREAQMDFQKYFEKFAQAHGGASKEDEAAFVQTLTPHQQDLYQQVQDQQSAASQLFFSNIQGKLAKKVKGMGFRKGF